MNMVNAFSITEIFVNETPNAKGQKGTRRVKRVSSCGFNERHKLALKVVPPDTNLTSQWDVGLERFHSHSE